VNRWTQAFRACSCHHRPLTHEVVPSRCRHRPRKSWARSGSPHQTSRRSRRRRRYRASRPPRGFQACSCQRRSRSRMWWSPRKRTLLHTGGRADVYSSSVVPSQSSSRPLQRESSAAGEPGVQLSTTEPATQEVVPVEAQAPTPQVVGTGAYSSSVLPSQSSSRPLQSESSAAGVPGVQLSTTEPPTQDVAPVAEQAPSRRSWAGLRSPHRQSRRSPRRRRCRWCRRVLACPARSCPALSRRRTRSFRSRSRPPHRRQSEPTCTPRRTDHRSRHQPALQSESSEAGVPGAQLSTTEPATHEVAPTRHRLNATHRQL